MKKYSICTVQYHVQFQRMTEQKNYAFPSKRYISNETKSVTVTHFTMKIIRTYLCINSNRKMIIVKKYLSLLWVFTDTYLYINSNRVMLFVKKYLSLLWVFTDTYLYINSNGVMLFVKKYLSLLWVFTDISNLLVSF